MTHFDIDTMDGLDIHSITFHAFRIGGKPAPCLMISVEQGMLDKDNCRSNFKHVFHAHTISDAIPQILARAIAFQGIGELLRLAPETLSNDQEGQ